MIKGPKFVHDCDECRFVTRYAGRDIYRCPQLGRPTIVARWGSDGPEYESGRLLWIKCKNDADRDALGFEATAGSLTVHNCDGIYRMGDRWEIALSPETAALLEAVPEDLRAHPGAPESFDRIAAEGVIDTVGLLAARIAADIQAKIRYAERAISHGA